LPGKIRQRQQQHQQHFSRDAEFGTSCRNSGYLQRHRLLLLTMMLLMMMMMMMMLSGCCC